MNNETKEILDKAKEISKYGDDGKQHTRFFNQFEAKALLDYITDLQEDNYVYHQLIRMENKREYRSKFLKEFQKEFGTNTFPDYDEIYKRYDKMKKENDRLNNIIDELEKWLEEEQDRLARECSHIYEDSLGKTKLVNEDIFNEITKIKNKLNELEKGK